MMVLRANALARGNSGIRVSTVETLLGMLAADILPIIPSQGSVGASGDLAPLAHLALGLMGEGRGARPRARKTGCARPSSARLRPVALGAKEGLALINGVQMSVAVGGLALHRALALSRVADLVGAASLDAARGSDAAFDRRIVGARPHPGALAERGQPAGAARRKRDPRIPPRLRPGPGQLRAALHAAGPRRGARRLRPRAGGPRARDEQRDGQPARLRRRGATSSREGTSTARRSGSSSTTPRSRRPTSPRSPSGASRSS